MAIRDQYDKIITGERCKEFQRYWDAYKLIKDSEVDLFWEHVNSGNVVGLHKRKDLENVEDIILDYDPETVNKALVETGKSHWNDTLCKYPDRILNLKLHSDLLELSTEELFDLSEGVVADVFFRVRGIDPNAINKLFDEVIYHWDNKMEYKVWDKYDEIIKPVMYEKLRDSMYVKDKIVSPLLESSTSEDIENHRKHILEYYKVINTFPQVEWSKSDEMADLSKLFNSGNIYNPATKRYGFGNAGLQTLEYFFPNLNDVFKNGIKHSIRTSFFDDYHFMTILRKALKYGMANSRVFYRWLRIGGVGYCTNFKPQVSKSLYETYGKPNCKVYDYAAGYAGRLLGAYAAHNVKEYVGVDVNTETVKYHQQLIKHLNTHYPNEKDVKTLLCGSEEFIQKNPEYINYFDLAFSSPQYFNTEIYSKEETQSCHKFSQYESWVHNFYSVTILNALDALKVDGVFGMNIFEKLPALKDVCKRICMLKGFILFSDDLMVLRSMPGASGKGKKRDLNLLSNGEPIWMFIHISEAVKRGLIPKEREKDFYDKVLKFRENNKFILDNQYKDREEPKQHLEMMY